MAKPLAATRRPAPSQSHGRRPITIEDLYRLRFVSDPQISPDGSRVAYVVAWADNEDRTKYRSHIVLARADCSEAPRPLTSGRHRDSTPRWSPDGRSLAFLSDRDEERPQLFLLSLDGGEPRQLTRLKHGAGPAVWSPDGSRIAFAAGTDIPEIARQEGQSAEKGKPPRVRVITRVKHKGDGKGLFEARRQHLFVLDLVSKGEPRQVTSGDWDDTDPTWSPDGERLAFVSSRAKDRDLSPFTDIWVVPVTGGRARRVTLHKGEASAPAWSPDGRHIAYVGHERGWTYGALAELLVVPTEGGVSRSLSATSGCEVGNVALSDARDPSAAQPPWWAPDGRSLLAPVSHAGQVSIMRFPVDGGAPTPVVAGNREVSAFSVAHDGERLAYAASDPTTPYEVYVAASDGTGERRVSHDNDDFLATVMVVAPEPFSTTSTDGETVDGWLLEPVDFTEEKQWPLVLEIHGGPEAMYAWTFMHEFQVLAARGYVVVYTNPRGSKGYGEAFTARIFANWGNQDAADCLAALEKASALPWVDRERLGVTGGSYGGFMTAWLVGHCDRFRAAVAQRGCYNFVSFYGTSDIGPIFSDYVFGGPVYEKEALYRECSPLSYAPSIRTPLLLIHSESDLRCPVEQAEQLFVQLRRLGKAETEFIRFPDESHNLSRSGRPDRRVERLERIVGWFDQHLR